MDPRAIRSRSAVFERTLPAAEGGAAEGRGVFVKVYTFKKHAFQRFLRQGRSRNEARNLLFFRKLGIAVPEVMAWGRRRNRLGRIVEEFIMTEAIVGAMQLDLFLEHHCPDRSRPADGECRDAIIRQLGKWTRAIHDHHFFHQDLKWRNILVRLDGGKPELFWIDCPKGGFNCVPVHRRRLRIKDCATLDKLARLNCTADERRLFVDSYFGEDGNPGERDRFAREVVRYRERRFDPEDDRQRIHAARNNQK